MRLRRQVKEALFSTLMGFGVFETGDARVGGCKKTELVLRKRLAVNWKMASKPERDCVYENSIPYLHLARTCACVYLKITFWGEMCQSTPGYRRTTEAPIPSKTRWIGKLSTA